MKARFGSIPDNEKWVEKKKWWVGGGGRGADHQVVEVFFISAPCNRHVEFQESRGLGASERGM